MNTQKCIVLGANGYIGRHMVKKLLDKGISVSALDLQNTSFSKEIPYTKIDIRNRACVEKIDLSCDFIFFFSGLTGTYQGFENYEQYVQVNEIGLLNVLDSIRRYKNKPRIIFSSTRLVYKGSEDPIRENGATEAKTIYAINKLTCENILKVYKQVFKIPFTIFRTCLPYGNLFDEDYSYGTIGFFLKNAKAKKPICLYGDGIMKRTFTHIEDVCDQILLASMHSEAIDMTYNVGGESFSLLEVANLFAERYNIEVTFCPWPKNDLLIESGSTVFDSERIEKLLNRPLKHALRNWISSL